MVASGSSRETGMKPHVAILNVVATAFAGRSGLDGFRAGISTGARGNYRGNRWDVENNGCPRGRERYVAPTWDDAGYPQCPERPARNGTGQRMVRSHPPNVDVFPPNPSATVASPFLPEEFSGLVGTAIARAGRRREYHQPGRRRPRYRRYSWPRRARGQDGSFLASPTLATARLPNVDDPRN